jgi:hypothetical protein
MRLDAARPRPTGQPEAVPSSLVGHRDPRNRAASPCRLVPPAVQQPQQLFLIRCDLLQRMALDPRHHCSDKPALLAHLDHRNQCAILIQSGERSAQVVWLRHGALRRWVGAAIVPSLRRSPHSFLARLSTSLLQRHDYVLTLILWADGSTFSQTGATVRCTRPGQANQGDRGLCRGLALQCPELLEWR